MHAKVYFNKMIYASACPAFSFFFKEEDCIAMKTTCTCKYPLFNFKFTYFHDLCAFSQHSVCKK